MDVESEEILPAHQDIYRLAYVIAVLWFLTLEAALRWQHLGFFVAIVVAIGLTSWSAWLWRRHQSSMVAALAFASSALTSIAMLTFVAGSLPQHLTAILSSVIIWTVVRQRQRQHDGFRGRSMALATAVMVWFGWYSLLSARVYLTVPLPWLGLGAFLLTAIAGATIWLEAGVAWQRCRYGLVAMGWFGVELFLVTWWMPTALLVGSVMAATIIALVVQATRHLWFGHWETGRGRRYLIVGTSLCVAVLVTARWI